MSITAAPLSFEKPFITVRTLIIGKAMQCTASYHTFTQQNSFNVKKYIVLQINRFSYLMLCYGCSEAFNYNSAHN
ncbi:hypothetical protein T4A_2170 [Trichinella pseudospiralis]|uniref:Uncharacterized protein n=1 Tax=Trichinella pseudospiralis TaxID=6337 RepID=A0A0V1E446_TRIPS|nr:hypothetical protein T4A_2170 [Trichinella pseudospiralis]